MNIVIYPGSEGNTYHFRDFSCTKHISFAEDADEIGVKIILEADFDFRKDLIKSISQFVTEMYLENYILCKIYDEYPSIDIIETSDILSEFTVLLSESDFGEKINETIQNYSKINLPSFVLFNIKHIMLTTNQIVDNQCEAYMSGRNVDVISAMISRYNALFTDDKSKDMVYGFIDDVKKEECIVNIKRDE